MPNWCRGTLKIRGEKENILKFFQEGLEVCGYFSGYVNRQRHKCNE